MQDNLILDKGLDDLFQMPTYAQSGDWYLGYTLSGGEVDGWRRYLHLGTGSTTPAVGDTTLVSETDRASGHGTFPAGSLNREWDSVNSLFRATSVVTRLTQVAADRNLTEIGLGRTNNTTVNIRSLLLNPGGSPITVSLLNGKYLRVDHTLICEIDAAGETGTLDIEEYDAANSLVNTVSLGMKYGPHANNGNASSINDLFKYTYNPSQLGLGSIAVGKGVTRLNDVVTYDPTSYITKRDQSSAAQAVTQTAYSPGTFERTYRFELAAGTGNAMWYGFMHASGSSNSPSTGLGLGALLVCFTGGGTYTKKSTDTMRFGMTLSFARA